MRSFSLWIRRLIDCRRGVTAVEFAFVLPILMFFTVGIMEFSTIFLAQNMLENAANYAAREGKTDFVQSGMTRDAYIKMLVQSRIDKLMDPGKVNVDAEVFKALDQLGKAEPYTDRNGNHKYDIGEPFTDTNSNGKWDADGGYSSGEGNGGDYIVYTVSYDWEILTPMLANILGQDGILTLSARIVVKNEPYGNG